MLQAVNPHTATCLALTRAISKSRTVDEIYAAALDALRDGLGVDRAAILLFDPDGVMRFKAYRGLSEAYRRAVEGHTPWRPDTPDPQPLVVPDVGEDSSLRPYQPVFEAEGIRAMAFIPLVSIDRVIGKFMLYYAAPAAPAVDELQLAGVIASQVAFAVERTRVAQQARRGEERLRFALDAASMGTWDWDLATNAVQWSDNLTAIHGLEPSAFDGTFGSYAREIHPDDRGRVMEALHRALDDGLPYDVEYRLVAPDGTVRWCEGKGRVEYAPDARPIGMSGVCMMVTRRKEAELARLAAAEESSRMKDDFLATLSHELRTPLNAMLGWIQMLRAGDLPEARRQQALEVIARNARLQAQLIEDILEVSRIITGKLEIEKVPMSVTQLLEAVVAGASPAAQAGGVTIEQRLPANLSPLEGDPRRLHQVFNNVVSNAIKFTPEGGSVSITCAEGRDGVEVRVRDTGIGISPEFLPYVFDRFRQADSRSTRQHGGLGLGLGIARHLVQLHGGEIRAHSDGAGRGTEISIRLPLAASRVAPVVLPAVSPPVEARLDGAFLLVLDDQPDSREMLSVMLERRGARVAQCDAAPSALEVLASQPIQLVIADIAMPSMDGYEFIRAMRASGAAIPAVAVTAFARPDDRQRALASGYTAYFPKPIDDGELARVVRALAVPGTRPVQRGARALDEGSSS
jgi:PAS domain S-box-containing protein